MDTDRVETLLTLVREPVPQDEGFTEQVMVRVQPSRLRSLRRFITRPMVIAAATLMIGSAAVAAIQQTDVLSQPSSQEKEKSAQGRGTKSQSPRPSKSQPTDEDRKDSAPATRPKPTPSESARPGGYTSPHTAYFSNGRLRIETETFTNSAPAGSPHDIRLTLENVTDDPIAVYGPKDCMLQATVHSGNSESKSQMTFCPGSPRPTKPSSDMEVVFIEPHEKIVSEITIFLPEKGTWFVTGQCPCGERQASSGEKSPSPNASPSPLLRTNLGMRQIGEETPAPSYRYGRLVTPPIRMEAG